MPHYTQENARTRSLNDARVPERKVPLLPRGPTQRKPTEQSMTAVS